MTASDAPCFARDDMSVSARKARTKLGRPAQIGERYPSGKLKPAEKQKAGPPPAQIKRLFDAALRGAADPLYGSALGLLFMDGAITAQELAAGSAYAKLRGRCDRALGLPPRTTASPDYGAARSAVAARPLADQDVETLRKRQAEMVARLDASVPAAWCAPDGKGGMRPVSLEADIGRRRAEGDRAIDLLERVCVDDQACSSYEVERLRRALRILVTHFGIDR